MPRKIQRYGWKPDLPDNRDTYIGFKLPKVLRAPFLPASVDLRDKLPPVYDQGQLGSCTANAIAGALQADQIRQKQKPFIPSRLFIYYNERTIEGSVNEDSGAQIRDGIKSIADLGAPHETLWPYVESRFAKKPTKRAYANAEKHQALVYERVCQSVTDLRTVLSEGYPFVFGFTVYESFENDQVAKTGVLGMPTSNESVVGGHAVLAVGYDHSAQTFTVRNSWGKDWGTVGYFTMPYDYVTNPDLADDFWVVRTVE